MSIVEKVSKNYDEIIRNNNMTLNEHDIEFLKKMFIEQDEIKEIIISELLDINNKKLIKSIDDLLTSHAVATHSELKVQEKKVESLLHAQETNVRDLLTLWEKRVLDTFEEVKKLIK